MLLHVSGECRGTSGNASLLVHRKKWNKPVPFSRILNGLNENYNFVSLEQKKWKEKKTESNGEKSFQISEKFYLTSFSNGLQSVAHPWENVQRKNWCWIFQTDLSLSVLWTYVTKIPYRLYITDPPVVIHDSSSIKFVSVRLVGLEFTVVRGQLAAW